MGPLRSLLPVVALLAGCSPDPSAHQPTETEAPAATETAAAATPAGSVAITATGDLLGEYRVAGVDGAELAGAIGIAVSIDGPVLSYEPTCAGFVWNIAEQDGGFSFTRANRQPDGTVVACAVAIAPEQQRLGEAIDAARHAWRTPANGILLEGGGRSALLFSQ